MKTPFGTLYTSNITPDPQTGIGRYSYADFEESAPRNYQILILPGDPEEHTWAIAGIITELSDEFPYDDKMARSVTLKVSGKPVLTKTGI